MESIDKGNTQGKAVGSGVIAKIKKAGIGKLVK
jgi:hypothetical protein